MIFGWYLLQPNMGSSDDLMPFGIRSLAKPMLTQIYDGIWHKKYQYFDSKWHGYLHYNRIICSREMYFSQFLSRRTRTQLLQSESQLFVMRHIRKKS